MPVLICQTQVINNKRWTISPKRNKFLYRHNKSRDWSASLTVEAAFIVPMFFFVIFLVWQIFLLLMFQLKVGEQVTKTLLEYSHLGYVEQEATQENVDISWLYETLLWTNFPEYKNVTGRWVNCNTKEDGQILVEIKYDFLCETIFFPTFSVPVIQTFQFYPYFGEQDEDKLNEVVEVKKEIVYMTEYGSVYHVSKTCAYLNVRLKRILFSDVITTRNNDGQLYTECSKCAEEERKEQVYISIGGNKYHRSLQCPAIKRTILEKTKEEVGGISICHKCQKQDEEKLK